MAEIEGDAPVSNLNQMQTDFHIKGCRLLKSLVYPDARGLFRKVFPISDQVMPPEFHVRQVNISGNTSAGTIRGLHYQIEPFLESKLVSCISGSIFDVLLDLRPNSKTYGKTASYCLTPDTGSILIPPLVAHGFQTLEANSSLLYLHSNEYSTNHSKGVNPLDPELGIDWPLPVTAISDADQLLPLFSRIEN